MNPPDDKPVPMCKEPAAVDPVVTVDEHGPHKRYEVKLVVHAHTWEEALRYLQEFQHEVESHGEECSLVSGGRGWIDIQRRPQQTQENYDRELAVWFEKRCQVRDLKRAAEKGAQLIRDLLDTSVGCTCNKPDHECGRNQREEALAEIRRLIKSAEEGA